MKINNSQIIIGTCGFTRKREIVYKNLDGVEIQESFYNLPSEKRAFSLKNSKPPGFVYTMKAWQVITHEASSPTWRKLKKKPPGNISNYGHLKPTKENIEAFENTLSIAKIIEAEVIVLQTPPGMKCEGREDDIETFFSIVKNIEKKILLAWEPRGNCKHYIGFLNKISSEHDVLIVRDAGVEEPFVHNIENTSILYTRLHGIGGKEVNYKYKYNDKDLELIMNRILNKNPNKAYIMFNNVYMYEDATRLRKMLVEGKVT